MGVSSTLYTSAVVVAFAVVAGFFFQPRVYIPDHFLGHETIFVPELVSQSVHKELLTLVKDMKDYPTNARDVKFYKTLREHVGEAQPMVNGTCEHPFLTPSLAKTECVLPGRVDVGRHYVQHGGVVGLKDTYETMISRVQSFGRYMFDLTPYPVISDLFASNVFQTAAKDVCPKDQQYLDPFQFNFIIQIPGQTVALHTDAPYFWGASRFEYPQWLLAAMAFSGLFEDKFIHQVQVVGYLHEWEDERDGSFVYWNTPDFKARTIKPIPRAGSSVDGSKTVHAAMVYHPHADLPKFNKDNENVLSYAGNDRWELASDGEVLRNYTTDDLRISIVYRARCFADAAEAERYNSGSTPNMELEEIMSAFTTDLVARGRLAADKVNTISRLDLALLIMDEYIMYPLPLREHALIPYNYCALGKLQPALKPLLSWICA